MGGVAAQVTHSGVLKTQRAGLGVVFTLDTWLWAERDKGGAITEHSHESGKDHLAWWEQCGPQV